MSDEFYEKLSQERKQGQAEGTIPLWYSTGGYQMFSSKYQWEANNVREQFDRIARTLSHYLPDPLKKEGYEVFFEMLWDGILSPSTPVLANTGTDRGFSISCAGNYTGDSVDQFYSSKHETAMLTKMGFGTSSYMGDVRSRGSKFKGGGSASGVVPLAASFVTDMQLVSQGSNRRGAFATYIPIDHGDFDELADYLLANPDDLNVGWNITDGFTERLNAQDPEALRRWKKALKIKAITGRGYFWFVDKANRKIPNVYKEAGLQNLASNLCSEILLPSNEEYTYSCVLSSLNLSLWERIKASINTDRNYIWWATAFLDCVVSDFLEKSKGTPGFKKIRAFTERFRALGLGVCGYHTMLMNKRIPWESLEANWLNTEIFYLLDKESYEASCDLNRIYHDTSENLGPRNASRIAIAPTKSTALLMGGISEGINPVPAFTFTQTTAAGNVDRIDPVLLSILKQKNVDVEKAIKQVTEAFGSVQNVEWLTDEEKQVFKTAFEIDQYAVLRHAKQRAKYLDQWQSVNLFFSADEDPQVIMDVHKQAVNDEDMIGLYYMYTLAGVKASSGECYACQ